MSEQENPGPQRERTEEEVFRPLTAGQRRFVRLWITGQYTKAEAYAEAYKRPATKSWAACKSLASRCWQSPRVQEAIQFLTSRENRKALLTRHEKRLFLAQVVRAHLPQDRAINPRSPLLKFDPLTAIKLDNEMSGDNAPVQVEGEITLGGILAQVSGNGGHLPGPRPVQALPIPSAGGGLGQLPQDHAEAVEIRPADPQEAGARGGAAWASQNGQEDAEGPGPDEMVILGSEGPGDGLEDPQEGPEAQEEIQAPAEDVAQALSRLWGRPAAGGPMA